MTRYGSSVRLGCLMLRPTDVSPWIPIVEVGIWLIGFEEVAGFHFHELVKLDLRVSDAQPRTHQ